MENEWTLQRMEITLIILGLQAVAMMLILFCGPYIRKTTQSHESVLHTFKVNFKTCLQLKPKKHDQVKFQKAEYRSKKFLWPVLCISYIRQV